MNTRRESCLDMLKVKCLIDPMLRSGAARVRLKTAARGEGGWLRLALRHFINPTILPPPSYTRARADDVYGPAFRRCIEFVTRNRLHGDILEFGTLLGYTARWWAALMREYDHAGALWLFDSFEGLPEISAAVDQQSYEVAINRVWFKGAMKVDSEIHVRIDQTLRRILPPERVHVIKGYFENTLRDNLLTQPVALLHLDCDLYSSAKTVLGALLQTDRVQDGTVLVVDDYNCNRAHPRQGLRHAIAEAFAEPCRFAAEPWFSYGWHGQTFLVHDQQVGNCPDSLRTP